MTIRNFKRYELKYIVSQEQYEMITKELLKYMNYDEFSQNGKSYMIYNIYFDTIDDKLIKKSIQKPYYKEKIRLRSYRVPTQNDDTVYLELKKKIGGIVAKRRVPISYEKVFKFMDGEYVPAKKSYQDNQVLNEISDFLDRYKVIPKLYLSYERVAFFGKTDSDFRVSFDKNIITRRHKVNLVDGDFGNELLNDEVIMEIKCVGALPLWLAKFLSQNKIYKTSFSKYGTEYKKYFKLKKHSVA